MIDALGGRKLLALAVAVAIGIGACLLKGDIPAGLLDLLKYGLGFFVAGNAVEHFVTSRTEGAEEAPVGDDTGITGRLDQLELQASQTQAGVAMVQQTLEVIIKKAWGA